MAKLTLLTEICKELRNWFDRGLKKCYGIWNIENGVIVEELPLLENQYFLISGSVFNDGVHQFLNPDDVLQDEMFPGTIVPMAIPKDFLALVDDIEKWQGKYGDIESPSMSPYSSEAFSGYSYTKSTGGGYGSGDGNVSWKNVFSGRLNRYRKI